MGDQADVQLAKRILRANVLDEADLRRAFELQKRAREEKGKGVSLARVLVHLKLLPQDGLLAVLAPSPLETQPFEGYRLERVIGEGGTSMVYGGVYLENNAPVAVKVLDPVYALREDWRARFREEARILSDVEHENVIFGYEVGTGGGLIFFSMEELDGLTVHEIIERRGALANQEALAITLQTARALGALHAAGYLHRDVKPQNLMVDEGGRVVLIDLGFIKRLEGEAAGSETTTVGTVEYLSPEQARGRNDLDVRSDIYSLGVSLYHMVVGEVPFQGENDFEVLAKQVLAGLDAQKVKQRRISAEIQFFITKMMSKDRDRRYEDMEQVARELEGYVHNDPTPVAFGDPVVAQPITPPVVPKQAPPEAPPGPPPGAAPVRRRRKR